MKKSELVYYTKEQLRDYVCANWPQATQMYPNLEIRKAWALTQHPADMLGVALDLCEDADEVRKREGDVNETFDCMTRAQLVYFSEEEITTYLLDYHRWGRRNYPVEMEQDYLKLKFPWDQRYLALSYCVD